MVESDPGQGKTSLALAMGQAFGLSVLRVQFYEGLTADKILYDYNYQRQLLSIQAIQSTLAKNLDGKTINEAMDVAKTIDFYGKDFLIRRPVLESIWGEQRYVLLFDEVDKASEELEYTLLELLDDFPIWHRKGKRRDGILSLSVAEPVPETDSVYFRRHHMGWLSAETDG